MSNYILKYSRGEEVKYISHLDFMRTFGRAVRRSGLAMSYSQGFNPHPILSVAVPMSVGVTGEGEYLRIGFDIDYTPNEIITELNKALPAGFEINAAVVQHNKNEYDFASITLADYKVFAETETEPDIDGFMKNAEIIVPKKTKSGTKNTDIKPLIHSIWAEKNEDGYDIYMRLSTGNTNLKPDTVIDAINKYTDDFKCEYYTVHRIALLNDKGEVLL